MRYFYIDDWYSYEDLYNLFGITLEPSSPLTLYDYDLNHLDCWEYNSHTWVEQDSQWYDSDNLPYFKKSGLQTKVYIIDKPMLLEVFTRRESNLLLYNNELNSFEYLHNTFGITMTSSTTYYVKNGIVHCWYNQELNKYWDVDTQKWYDEAPDYSDIPSDVDSINKVGAIAMFLFEQNATNVQYGTLVNGLSLKQISINMPRSGEVYYSKSPSVQVTGTWRLLTSVKKSSVDDPCTVLAIKVSSEQTQSSLDTYSPFVESVNYDL